MGKELRSVGCTQGIGIGKRVVGGAHQNEKGKSPIGVGCAHLKGTGNRTNGVRCTHQNGMGKKPGGTLQEGICWSPEGVGHTHWNRNEPKPDEEQEVGL